jgi:hypothetical protein
MVFVFREGGEIDIVRKAVRTLGVTIQEKIEQEMTILNNHSCHFIAGMGKVLMSKRAMRGEPQDLIDLRT